MRTNRPTTTLFIYGTLKRGDVRAPLLAGQHFIAETMTLADYRLFNTGAYPALVEAKALGLPGRPIRGELWEVDEACLARLDEEEGIGEGLYARKPIGVTTPELAAEAYFYLHPVEGMEDLGESWPVGG